MHKSLNITLTLSLCGHLLGLVFIQPSLGDFYQKDSFLKIFFLGSLLSSREIYPVGQNNNLLIPHCYISRDKQISVNLKIESKKLFYKKLDFFYFGIERPLFDLHPLIEKTLSYPKPNLYLSKEEIPIMFYPYLPHSFLLYFKDRQKVNLELLFYISKDGKIDSIKRKISCGSLEVDLLVLRHISRSLYLIKDSFPYDCWQTVKIELKSHKDDQS